MTPLWNFKFSVFLKGASKLNRLKFKDKLELPVEKLPTGTMVQVIVEQVEYNRM